MYKKVDSSLNFVEREEKMVEFWQENDVLGKMIEKNKNGKVFSFFEGPPTANGKPHIGHVLTRTIKDLYLRFNTMKGYNVYRQGGWDTHGLPVELEVEKQIGSTGKEDIEKYGVEPFIAKCKENVWLYKDMWEKFSHRMGYTVDNDNAYITYSNNYIESVWWSLSELFKKGLIYQGYRIVPYCPRCSTSLSSQEVAQGYKDVKEKTVYAKFKALDAENTYFLAWTTTPWTLPSNVALCMNAKEKYAKIKVGEEFYILATALIPSLFKDDEYTLVDEKLGKDYEFAKYEPLFDFVKDQHEGKAWFVVNDDYVTLTDGTGIVHIAPAFGEDDSKVGKKYNLPFVQLVDSKGCIPEGCGSLSGLFVKKADPVVIEILKQENKLLKDQMFEHSYPHCWRCSTPLIYYARTSWFVATTKMKDQLIANNEKVDWRPETIGEGRMGGFLKGLIDWDIGRNRYWGTPLPFWVCKDCGHVHAVGSVKELKERAGLAENVEIDLHKPFVDKLSIKCDKCGGQMNRVPEVLDCWYDSGSMPFAELHYPFENKEKFEKAYPAEFISEGMDQTRGWFYSLLAVNTLLFGKAPYKRVLPLGLVNDEHGKKMSKSLGNVVAPYDIFNKQGTDAVRWYFYTANNPWLGTSFKVQTLEEFQRKFMGTLWNTYYFYCLYADIDNFDGSKSDIRKCELSNMDRWIISEFNKLVKVVDESLSNYVSTEPARAINVFVDNLSNWYVRRSRERFWSSGENDDKTAAFTTLYYCLTGLVKVIAPFVPAIADEIYQNIVRSVDKNAPISVHLCDFPVADESLIDEKLNEGMENVLEVVVLGRSARNLSGIKNRQPLSELVIATNRKLALTDELVDLIKDELRVENVTIAEDASKYISYELKPQLKTLGPKYGPLLGGIRNHLTSCDANAVVDVVNAGKVYSFDINGTTVELSKDDLLIAPKSKEGFVADSNNGITVVLDTNLTEELIEKGFVRELISKIQNQRKDAGFEVVDHIEITFNANENLIRIIEKFAEEIKSGTLADSVTNAEPIGNVQVADINGEKVTIGLINKK